MGPLVSVGMPVHNGAAYLEAALESVLSQTWTELEVVLVDNASDDGSLAIAERFARSDGRVRIVRSHVNRGAAWSHNEAFRSSHGSFFRWASHDDLSTPDHLERCLEVLLDDPSIPLARPRALEIDENGDALFLHQDEIDVSSDDPVERFCEVVRDRHGCMDIYGLIRADVLRRTALIGPYPASDRVLLAELALRGRWSRIPDPLFLHRQHLERSVRRFPDRRERAVWFDPTVAGKRFVFPIWRQLAAYLGAVRRGALTGHQRTRCMGVLAQWVAGQPRSFGGDLRRALQPMPKRLSP